VIHVVGPAMRLYHARRAYTCDIDSPETGMLRSGPGDRHRRGLGTLDVLDKMNEKPRRRRAKLLTLPVFMNRRDAVFGSRVSLTLDARPCSRGHFH